MSKEKMIIGVLGGIAAGAILGVLFAPGKGSDTRKKMSRESTDAVDELKSTFSDLVTDFNEKFEAARVEARALFEKSREEIRKDLSGQIMNHRS